MASPVPMPAARTIDVGGIGTALLRSRQRTSPSSSSMAEISEPRIRRRVPIAWNLNLLPLSSRFRVIAFDKVGQGYTDNPLNDDYTMDAVVQHAAGFLAR